MFSGIIEAQSNILSEVTADSAIRIEITKPQDFNDLKIGDSICTNGICLTIEKLDSERIQFCLGAETLQLLGPAFSSWKKQPLNLERSLRLGDRVHGHLVTGHVDCAARVHRSYQDGECWQMQIEIPAALKNYFWKKSSICLNGVSLTVNQVQRVNDLCLVNVCLIPETIKKTNLSQVMAGDAVCVEADYLAKAYLNQKEGALAELNT
ncbi:MAG: riboflavin synthase [Bdellovibrionaceae bacterium]|nr:riboflavin synthase [Bdellovibrio sp.]